MSSADHANADVDIHTTAGKIADLRRRIDEAVHSGSARAVEKQHAKGKMTARERVRQLLDEDSFVEFDEFARHRSTNFGQEKNRPYGDGVVTGYGTVDGRQVAVFAQVLARARGRDHDALDRSIDVQVLRLRQIVEDDPSKPRFIKTVWGVGYMLAADVDS